MRAQLRTHSTQEQVVERVGLERLHREVAVGRDEEDGGQLLGRNRTDDPEAIGRGHLHVQEDEVRTLRLDGGDGLAAISALADDLHVGFFGQGLLEALTGEQLVIDNPSPRRSSATAGAWHPPAWGPDTPGRRGAPRSLRSPSPRSLYLADCRALSAASLASAPTILKGTITPSSAMLASIWLSTSMALPPLNVTPASVEEPTPW